MDYDAISEEIIIKDNNQHFPSNVDVNLDRRLGGYN